MNIIYNNRNSYFIVVFICLVLLGIIIIEMSLTLIPQDYYGYGQNKTSEIESFNTSNNGQSCNPLIPTTYLNSVAGSFTLILGNANQSVVKTFIITGINIITISTTTGEFVMSSANSPVIMTYSAETWSSTSDAEPTVNKTPLVQVVSNSTFYFGSQIVSSPTYTFISSTGYNKGSGAIFIYNTQLLLSGNTTPLQILEGINGFVSGFGSAVSANDQYLFVGAPGSNLGAGLVGVVNIFENVNDVWTLKQKINYPNTFTYACFGYIVANSDNGEVLAISAPAENAGQGAVYIYRQNTNFNLGPLGVWNLEKRLLTPFVVTNPSYGFALSLSGTGTTLAVSSPQGTPAAIGTRGVIIYIYDTSLSVPDWVVQQTINPVAVRIFGEFISLDSTGDILAFSQTSPLAGNVQVYTRTAGVWAFQQSLTPAVFPVINITTLFGFTLSISRDGTKLAIANPRDGSSDQGAVWYYNFTGGVWVETAKFVFPNSLFYGLDVQISYNGDKFLISNFGPLNNGSVNILNYAENIVDLSVGISSQVSNSIQTYQMNTRVSFSPTARVSFAPDMQFLVVVMSNIFHFYQRSANQFTKVYEIITFTNSSFTLTNNYFYNVNIEISGTTANCYLDIYQKNITYTTNSQFANSVKSFSWSLINHIFLQNIPAVAVNGVPSFVVSNPNESTVIVQIIDITATTRTVYVFDYILGVITLIQTFSPAYYTQFNTPRTPIALSNDALTMPVISASGVSNTFIYTRASLGVVFALATTIVGTGTFVADVAISDTSPYILATNAINNRVEIFSGSGAVWTLLQTITSEGGSSSPIAVSQNGKYVYVGTIVFPSTQQQIGRVNIYKSANLTTWALYKTLTPTNANVNFYGIRTNAQVQVQFGANLQLALTNGILVVASTAYGGSGGFFIYS